MARRLSWSDVRGGLIASSALVVAVVATLKYSRVDSLHGDTFRLYAHVGEARGVLVGSEVWLSGQKVGRISNIRFRSPSVADTAARIEITMEVLERYRNAMHRDARAQIRAGGTIIGAEVVYVTPGTVASTVIRHDDTVATQSQADIENSAGKFGAATHELPAIVGNVKEIISQLQTSQGTMGAVLNAPGGPGGPEMARALAQAQTLQSRLAGREALGYATSAELTERARQVMARADSVRALLASDRSSYGRLRKDSTLMKNVNDVQRELSAVRASLDEPRGSVGRYRRDTVLTNALAGAHLQLSLLLDDLKKHPLRYISF